MAARRRSPLGRPHHDGAPRRPRLVRRCTRGPATVPEALLEGAVEQEDGTLLVPLARSAAEAHRGAPLGAPRRRRAALRARPCSPASTRCRPRASSSTTSVEGERFKLEVLLGPRRPATAFEQLPGAEPARRASCRSTRGSSTRSTASSPATASPSRGRAADALDDLRVEAAEATEAIRRSRATTGEPIPEVAERLGGTLQPFQWAGVRYALDVRRTFLADEQGLGKTVEALADARGRRRLPGGRHLPRVAEAQLGARDEALAAAPRRRVVEGRSAVPRDRRDHDPQLRDRRRAPRGAGAPAPAGARRRRVALREEPAGQAHAGGPPAGRDARRLTRCAWR